MHLMYIFKLFSVELSSEYVVKTLNSDDITVEQIPDFPSFDEWEENFTALSNPHAREGEQGLGEIMFKKGIFTPVEKVHELDINPRERTDQVEVKWKN